MVEKVDVLVVGGASAGYAAAVAAAQSGAERVLVLEKAPRNEVGGNCRYSAMGFRFVHDGTDDVLRLLTERRRADAGNVRVGPYSADTFLADLATVTQKRIDDELAQVLVEDSRGAIDWMTETGHQWEFFHTKVQADGFVNYNPGQVLVPVGGGLGLVERWIAIGDQEGVEMRCGSRVSALLGDSREVRGAIVDGPEGRYEVEAGAVVLASGGFQASAEKRARYLTMNADLMKVRGSRFNTGEVLQMAIDLGAATSGQWQGAHASPIDASAPPFEADNTVNRYSYPYGISVNRDGKRFFDEGERHRSYTYAKTGWAVLSQPGATAYQIYDQQAVPFLTEAYSSVSPVTADTISELATKLELDPASLEDTVREYNSSVDTETPFVGTREDGRGTIGISPRHTNWANRLEQAPFLAFAVACGVTFSFGGLKINRDAQVLNVEGEPIRGLHANGDILGLFYHNYPSFSGMTRNVVFGGRAGAAAAEAAS